MQCDFIYPRGGTSISGLGEKSDKFPIYSVHFCIFMVHFVMSHLRNVGFWHLFAYSDPISAEIRGSNE